MTTREVVSMHMAAVDAIMIYMYGDIRTNLSSTDRAKVNKAASRAVPLEHTLETLNFIKQTPIGTLLLWNDDSGWSYYCLDTGDLETYASEEKLMTRIGYLVMNAHNDEDQD